MLESNEVLPSFNFSGHETFPFRLSWLHKGVLAISTDSHIFSSDDAIVELGVGKNMVRSIKHWCHTLELITDSSEGRRGNYEPTELGQFLFGSNGQDPFLEHGATIWWIHWKLATSQFKATSWYYVFNLLNRPTFKKENIVDDILSYVTENTNSKPSKVTIERDVDCLIRTYSLPRKNYTEEMLEFPLAELSLIRDSEDGLRLSRGEKATLPDLIFTAALVDFFIKSQINIKTLAAEKIIYNEGSPGRVFLLDENSVVSRLEKLEIVTEGRITYDSTAGMRQVLFHSTADSLEYLRQYFRGEKKS